MKFNTQLLHGKAVTPYADGSTIPHISQSVEYQFDSAQQTEKVFRHTAPGYAYTRVANPTITALEQRLSEIEGGIGAYAAASGMSAVVLSILNMVSAGDEIISGNGVYGGTIEIFKALSNLGVKIRFVRRVCVEEIEPLMNEHTRVIFGELVGNPSLNVMDVPAVAQLAHAHGIPLIVDATTSSPWIAKPLKLGADYVVHSTTKYIAGSGQAMGGVIIDGGSFLPDPDRYPALAPFHRYGNMGYLVRLRTDFGENFGGTMSPFNAYLTVLGLETLGLRMERICDNAQKLAQALDQLGGLSVNYPTLASHPDKALVDRDMNGKGAGLITFRAGSKENAFRIINRLHYAQKATSLGDVRTLVIHPASTIYIHTTPEQNKAAGVYEDTVRISVGIEDADDLIEDFTQALLLRRSL